MSQAVAAPANTETLTGLLLPLADRTLLVPNVALAELVPYRAPSSDSGYARLATWVKSTGATCGCRLLSFEAALQRTCLWLARVAGLPYSTPSAAGLR